MSIRDFVMHGLHRGFLLVRDGGAYGPIELYDISEPEMVGAKYSDGSCQAQPTFWHEHYGVVKALHKLQKKRLQERPRLLRRPEKERPHLLHRNTEQTKPKLRPHLRKT